VFQPEADVKRINVADARPGMVLAEPIVDRRGRVIVKKGSALTQLYISRLRKWGVRELTVAEAGASGVAPAGAAGSAGEGAAAAEGESNLPPGITASPDLPRRIAATFSAVEDDPLMCALREIVTRHLQALSGGG
jgi:hypothetical protein